MIQKRAVLMALAVLLIGIPAASQMTSWLQWTFLPQSQMDEIIGEASGEAAFNHVMAMCGFPRDRKSAEYAGTFAEAQYVFDRLKDYGLADAVILRYPGGETWDGVKGELWELKPGGHLRCGREADQQNGQGHEDGSFQGHGQAPFRYGSRFFSLVYGSRGFNGPGEKKPRTSGPCGRGRRGAGVFSRRASPPDTRGA